MRYHLVGALLSWVETPLRGKTNKFLRGLALDELQFLAGFCGSCVLESGGAAGSLRAELALRIARYSACPSGFTPSQLDLKMILLVEYLHRAGLLPSLAPVRG